MIYRTFILHPLAFILFKEAAKGFEPLTRCLLNHKTRQL